jgi:hypothetical protein
MKDAAFDSENFSDLLLAIHAQAVLSIGRTQQKIMYSWLSDVSIAKPESAPAFVEIVATACSTRAIPEAGSEAKSPSASSSALIF